MSHLHDPKPTNRSHSESFKIKTTFRHAQSTEKTRVFALQYHRSVTSKNKSDGSRLPRRNTRRCLMANEHGAGTSKAGPLAGRWKWASPAITCLFDVTCNGRGWAAALRVLLFITDEPPTLGPLSEGDPQRTTLSRLCVRTFWNDFIVDGCAPTADGRFSGAKCVPRRRRIDKSMFLCMCVCMVYFPWWEWKKVWFQRIPCGFS